MRQLTCKAATGWYPLLRLLYVSFARRSSRHGQSLIRLLLPARSLATLPCNNHDRVFADAIECVRGDAGRVVAVTSADKARAFNEAKPDFWQIRKVI